MWALLIYSCDTLVTVLGYEAEDWRGLELASWAGLGWFYLGPKAPIPQEIQFGTKSRNVTPQCWAEICCGLRSQASGLSGGGWGEATGGAKGVGAWPPAPVRAALSPLHPIFILLAEGGADWFPGCPASRTPGGGGAAPWPCCAVRAQQGAWGILVSDPGVCGVLAGSPAVWASWAAASFSQGGRARPPPMKATLSGSAQPGEGAPRGAGGLKLQPRV